MRERVGFIAAVERNELTFCEICERFGVSRKTGYKWLARYEATGPAGLVDLSRRPHQSPNATPRRVADRLEESFGRTMAHRLSRQLSVGYRGYRRGGFGWGSSLS
jgi:transposase